MRGVISAIRCTRNPTCAKSARAKGALTVQNGRLRSARPRVQEEAAAPLAGASRNGPRSIQASTMGTRTATMSSAASELAERKPSQSLANKRSGAPIMPAKLAPLSARLIASPRRSWNQAPISVLMVASPMAAQPNDITR